MGNMPQKPLQANTPEPTKPNKTKETQNFCWFISYRFLPRIRTKVGQGRTKPHRRKYQVVVFRVSLTM
jgi:hypothetical protein